MVAGNCIEIIHIFGVHAKKLKWIFSFESSLGYMLLVFILYNICKYIYNEPKKSKDKLTFALYSWFFSNSVGKASHLDILGRIAFSTVFLVASKGQNLKLLFTLSSAFVDFSDYCFIQAAVMQTF
jgi:hypothetical protein